MSISAAQVNELRKKTGAGMMDCKKALSEANGDLEKAIEILRKKGASVAAKRADKSTNEGLVVTQIFNEDKSAVIVEVNCETDFVAKSDDFVSMANAIVEEVIKSKPVNVTTLNENAIVIQKISEGMGKVGEKIEVSRFAFLESNNGLLVDYIHPGSKLGVLVQIDNVPADKKELILPIAKDIAMQVAAMKPLCTFREEVAKDVIDKEIEIYKEISRKEGKPEQILDKIAQGKLSKYYQENCLFEQAYIKDNSKTIASLLKEFNVANSSEVNLVTFRRFHLGDEQK